MKKVLFQLGKAWVDGLGSWLLTYKGALAPIASFPIPFDIYRCNGMSFGSKMLHNVEKGDDWNRQRQLHELVECYIDDLAIKSRKKTA